MNREARKAQKVKAHAGEAYQAAKDRAKLARGQCQEW